MKDNDILSALEEHENPEDYKSKSSSFLQRAKNKKRDSYYRNDVSTVKKNQDFRLCLEGIGTKDLQLNKLSQNFSDSHRSEEQGNSRADRIGMGDMDVPDTGTFKQMAPHSIKKFSDANNTIPISE